MRTLNIVLTIMLLIVTLAYFVNDDQHSATIKDLRATISSDQKIVNDLTYDNKIISNRVDSLKEVAFSLKGVLLMYEDSIEAIHNNHIIQYNEVSTLSDSASYKYFLDYLRTK